MAATTYEAFVQDIPLGYQNILKPSFFEVFHRIEIEIITLSEIRDYKSLHLYNKITET